MTGIHVQRPEGYRPPLQTAVAVFLLAFALWIPSVYLFLSQPVRVTIDGRERLIRTGTTVREVIASGMTTASRGDVIGVRGDVVGPGGGGLPRVTVNGRSAALSDGVYWGSVLKSSRGRDLHEPVITSLSAVRIPVQEVGRGPDVLPRQLGSPGLAVISKGAVSRVVVARVPVRSPTPMVVLRRPFPAGTKLVALTFDDGPWPGQTLRVLDILEREGVHATFFMNGIRARMSPSVAREVARDGHLVGNHTLSHLALRGATLKAVVRQMAGGRKLIRRYAGVDPRWFRAPGGGVSPRVRAVARRLNERVVNWTVDPSDWRKPPASVIVKRVVRRVHPGAIVLMHDGGGYRGNTIAALPKMIRMLRAKGYRFVTLDELHAAR